MWLHTHVLWLILKMSFVYIVLLWLCQFSKQETIKINEPTLILIHGKGKTDGAGKQKGWLQLSSLDDKWPCIVLERGSFVSACIKTLCRYHSSHHCHHHYQHFHYSLSWTALVNREPLILLDSVGGAMTSGWSEITFTIHVRSSVN